jgi:predicted DNA binding CopG/RHH family protein
MKKRRFHDNEERTLITAYERGEFRPVKDQDGAKRTAREAAQRYTRKDARINIRLSLAVLEMLKRRAVKEGLPYQSLIASVLHKYAAVLGQEAGMTRPMGPTGSGGI